MSVTTLRATHNVTDAWTDATLSIAGAANVTGYLVNYGDAALELVKGGNAAPDASVRGKPILAYGQEWCETDHIWVKCRISGQRAVIGFEAWA